MRQALRSACAILLLAASAGAADEMPDPLAGFIGTWEYRQANPESPSGFDDVGERLEVTRRGGSLRVAYFGVEREGDHGLFFSATEVEDVSVHDDGRISFVVPETRRYHGERPSSLEAERRMPDQGSLAKRLQYTGGLVGDELRLTCSEEFPGTENCPAPSLVFQRAPWTAPRKKP